MREAIQSLPGSKIREVANAGLGRSDVLAFWFGESDEVTAPEALEATVDSLRRGETFYSHNLGLPELREALAAYVGRLHGAVGAERIAVTSSGVSALMLAAQALLSPGDEVVCVTPVWPNLTAQPLILGARVTRVALQPQAGAWRLDLARLLAAVTPATRVLMLNAPGNPTGWTLTGAEQQALLDHCRRTGTWIVADEVYERLWYGDGPAAPSFLDIAAPQDRLLVTHSFSKSFLMTGWRLGWLVLPAGWEAPIAKLIEFNTSCAPVFVQRGALAALALGLPVPLDGLNRPASHFSTVVHQGCTRNEYHEYDVEDTQPGDRACLFFNLGCQGPMTQAVCNTDLWNGVSSKTRAGVPCFGCTSPGFPRDGDLFRTEKMGEVPIHLPLGVERPRYMAYKNLARAAAPQRVRDKKMKP